MDCKEYVESYNKRIELDYLNLVDSIKKMASKYNNVSIYREKEDFIIFEVSRKTSVITFTYFGSIRLIDIGTVNNARRFGEARVNGILYTFKQNDTGRFNTYQELTNKILTPNNRTLEENDLYFHSSIEKGISKTSNLNSFKSSINKDITEYVKA